MAINIYSGSNKSSSPSRKKRVAKAIKTIARPVKEVAQNLNAELKGKAVSSEGTTAVTKSGILQTVGTLAKKALPIAAKYLPGVAGTVAKLGESIFNDPEWWQHIPGESVSMNAPLNKVAVDTDGSSTINNTTPITYTGVPLSQLRPVILEFSHKLYFVTPTGTIYDPIGVFNPSDEMITQYLMSEIRKVVNAVPLQAAADYAKVLANNVVAYATWRTLKKFDYMLKHGQTYLPSFNDVQYPILQVENAAYLQSTINRLEEYLHASCRLPHTLCEYLAWRFGRIYKVNQNVKSALVLYDVISMQASLNDWKQLVDDVTTFTSTTTAYQFAATDIFNAYYTHDMDVIIRDDTQFVYDMKEFMLRTNLDVLYDGNSGTAIENVAYGDLNPIKIDSGLDNPTVFMASTISTVSSQNLATNLPNPPLIPVAYCHVHVVGSAPTFLYSDQIYTGSLTIQELPVGWHVGAIYPAITGSNFSVYEMSPFVDILAPVTVVGSSSTANANFGRNLFKVFLAKMVEYYNAGFYFRFGLDSQTCTYMPNTYSASQCCWIDVTAVSDDLGVVSDSVVKNEQVFAFANLIYPLAKSSETMKQAEAKVAKDTANMISTAGVVAVK